MSREARAAFAADAPLVLRRLDGAWRACERLVAGGVGWPDADAAGMLHQAADALRTLGFSGGAERLERLGDAVSAVVGSPDRAARDAAAGLAEAELHGALAWLRVARAEVDLVLVEATSSGSAPQQRTHARPVASTGVRPVGLERIGARAVVHGIDAIGPVMLVDTWIDPDPIAPLSVPVISRLFGDRIVAGRLLAGTVHVSDHPVATEGEHRVFRASFVARPQIDPELAGDVAVPRASLDEVLARGRVVPAARSVPVDLNLVGEAPVLSSGGVELPLGASPTRDLVLAKLAIRGDTVGLRAVVRRRASELVLIGLEHPVEGRGVPDWDPGLYPLSAADLLRRVPLDTVPGVWLAAGLVRVGAPDRSRVLAAMAALDPTRDDELWRLEFAAESLGHTARPDGDAVRSALAGATPDTLWPLLDRVSLAELAQAVELERRALWEAFGAGDLTGGASGSPSIGRICARAMQLANFGPAEHGATGPERAGAFLDAHLATRRHPGDDPDAWPSPVEWLWLARARSHISGPCAVRALQPDLPRLLHSVSALILRWARHGDPALLMVAGDALWCAASADLARYVLK
ncbi:MAG: hypothetical protein ACI8PZ_001139 [Myxococcota bacterium]|jgi:hypothetical protein